MHHLLASVRRHEGRGGREPFALTLDAFWGRLLVADSSRQPSGLVCPPSSLPPYVHLTLNGVKAVKRRFLCSRAGSSALRRNLKWIFPI